jgi:hypothetical protein
MSPEKRKFERFDLTLHAEVAVVGRNDTKGQRLSLTTKNICEGGACFVTSQSLPPGTEVSVHLMLPLNGMEEVKEQRASVRAKGRVSRSESDGMAVSFNRGITLRPWGPLNSH